MSGYRGFTDYFPYINKIKAEKIAFYLGFKDDLNLLENKIANRILYPSSIAKTKQELLFDLSLLFEALRMSGELYFKKTLKKIYIPEGLLHIFPDDEQLVQIFIDALNPPNFTMLILKTNTGEEKILGTLIKSRKILPGTFFIIWLNGKKYQFPQGKINFLPVTDKAKIIFGLENKDSRIGASQTVKIEGGDMGLIVDTRY